MYTFIYNCAYKLVSLNALRYYPMVSKATDKKETNNYLVLCFVEKKRQTDSMRPLTSCVHRIISGLFVEM